MKQTKEYKLGYEQGKQIGMELTERRILGRNIRGIEELAIILDIPKYDIIDVALKRHIDHVNLILKGQEEVLIKDDWRKNLY